MAIQVYARSDGGALRQGEIISDFTQHQLDVEQLRAGNIVAIPVHHPYVVVLTQDCDLDQDFRRRSAGEVTNLLASVNFCAAAPANADFRRGAGLDSKEWKRFKQNQDPRLHYIRDAPIEDDLRGEGVPDLAIDFRQSFALPTAEAYFMVESARRRCRLETPYAEHLNLRFASHITRIALPLDHHQPMPVDGIQPTAEAAATAVAGAATTVLEPVAPTTGSGENGAPPTAAGAPSNPAVTRAPVAQGPPPPIPAPPADEEQS